MKKIFTLLLAFLFCFGVNLVYAADEYMFDLTYEGEIIVDEEKDAIVELIGVNGPTYTNVRIKVDIEGPEIPTIYAYDSQGTKIDIAQIGYWGPDAGFAVSGTFTNTTPITATFTEAGTYVITLTLIDLQDNNNVLAKRDFTVDVSEKLLDDNTTDEDEDNLIEENDVEEIPKTGRSAEEYVGMAVVLFAIVGIGTITYRRKI